VVGDEVQPGRRRWGWVRRAFDPGTSLVFARQVTPEQVIRGFRLDPAAGKIMTGQQAAGEDWGVIRDLSGSELPCPFVQTGRCGDWAFAVDPSFLALNSAIQGHYVLATLSAGSEAVEVLWTAKPGESVEYYADGEPAMTFEPYRSWERWGPDRDRFVSEMRQAGLHTEPPSEPALRAEHLDFDVLIGALEMLTIALGIGLTEDLIAGPLLTVPIPARLAATI
jgi:Family of unknown function (DUF6461)